MEVYGLWGYVTLATVSHLESLWRKFNISLIDRSLANALQAFAGDRYTRKIPIGDCRHLLYFLLIFQAATFSMPIQSRPSPFLHRGRRPTPNQKWTLRHFLQTPRPAMCRWSTPLTPLRRWQKGGTITGCVVVLGGEEERDLAEAGGPLRAHLRKLTTILR